MLWEKQPLTEIVQQLDNMGIGIAVFDPCANRPASGDFLSVMQDNIANLRQAYTNWATPRSQVSSFLAERGREGCIQEQDCLPYRYSDNN